VKRFRLFERLGKVFKNACHVQRRRESGVALPTTRW
jgi:hypothetical protein